MKGMVALELGVIERLVTEARAAGRDPGSDPIPGLRRDVLFTCAADEEAGGTDGALWFATHRPDWLSAAAAVNECGGVSVTVGGRRLYPIQVAEKPGTAYNPLFIYGGTGLGLAIVHRIVDAHGGRVSVSNNGPRLGDGARVEIVIPRRRTEAIVSGQHAEAHG